jgi:hypothetical protein
MDRRPLNVKLLVQAAAFVANHQAVALVRTVNIAMPDVWMPET